MQPSIELAENNDDFEDMDVPASAPQRSRQEKTDKGKGKGTGKKPSSLQPLQVRGGR